MSDKNLKIVEAAFDDMLVVYGHHRWSESESAEASMYFLERLKCRISGVVKMKNKEHRKRRVTIVGAEIDLPLIDAVQALNETGLTTHECCRGDFYLSEVRPLEEGGVKWVRAAYIVFDYDIHAPGELLELMCLNDFHHTHGYEGLCQITAFDDIEQIEQIEQPYPRYSMTALCTKNRQFVSTVTEWALRRWEDTGGRKRKDGEATGRC